MGLGVPISDLPNISNEFMPRKITSLSLRADEDMTQVIPHWDAAVSSSQLEMVESSLQPAS